MADFLEIPRNRQVFVKAYIGRSDGVTWTDISDHVTGIQVDLGNVMQVGTGRQGGDSVVKQLSLSLQNSTENSFQPLDRTSDWNIFNSSYDPLLWVNREVRISVAVKEISGTYTREFGTTQSIDEMLGVGDGSTSVYELEYSPVIENPNDSTKLDGLVKINGAPTTDYILDNTEVPATITLSSPAPNAAEVRATYTFFQPLFAGYLGDSINSNKLNTEIEVKARDYSKLLMDTFIMTDNQYGSETGELLEIVIQSILNDNLSNPPSLRVIGTPEGAVKPYKVENKSVFTAIQELASTIGWFLGYMWHWDTFMWELTFMEPPRDKNSDTADYAIQATTDIYDTNLDINDHNIRNDVTVVYRNKDTDQVESVTVFNQDSIDEFGRRKMKITEAQTSMINTETEALLFANAALNDLKNLSSTNKITTPILPQMDLYSGIVLRHAHQSSTEDFYAVESVRHTIQTGLRSNSATMQTTMICSGSVKGAHITWLEMETRPGSQYPIPPEDVGGGGVIMPAPNNVQAFGMIDGILITFDYPQAYSTRWVTSRFYISDTPFIDIDNIDTYDYVYTGRTNRMHLVENLTYGVRYYCVVVNVSTGDILGEPSIEVDAVAGMPIVYVYPAEFERVVWKDDHIEVTWKPHPNENFDQYELRLNDDFGSNM